MAKLFTFKNKRTMPAWFAVVLLWFLRVYAATLRVHLVDCAGMVEQVGRRKMAIALWHNRVIFAALLAPKKIRPWICPLISASRDGNYISTLAEHLGYQPVRGSSSRGGAAAMVQLKKGLEDCRIPLITVDGPRGPRYTVHNGIAALGIADGVDIVPVSFNFHHYWYLNNWDRTQIPVPFTRVDFIWGEPLHLEASLSYDEGCARAREAMMKYTKDLYGEGETCRDRQ